MPHRLIGAIGFSCCVSLALLIIRIIDSDSERYIFLIWNLVLAIIPVLLTLLLVQRARQSGWLNIKQILLSLVWLSFLPNCFYLTTDLVHLRLTNEASLFFDVILLTSFAFNGLVLGFFSVYAIHKELEKLMKEATAYQIIGAVLLISSFAAYLGRFTRWNTWDIVLQPAGLLFDVSDRFINPSLHTATYSSTLTLFILIASMYVVVWETIRYLQKQ